MKFGTTYSQHWDGDLPQAQIFQNTLDYMQLADKLGFWSAWITEHHFANDPDYKPYGYDKPLRAYDVGSDPLSFLAYAAAVTKNIKLGTGVLVLHYDSPLRVAERAAILDILSKGRLELGVGRGSGYLEPPVFHNIKDKPTSRRKFIEEVQFLIQAWKGEPFEFNGEFFQMPRREIIPHPYNGKSIPLFLGVSDEPGLRFAAQNGLSYAGTAGAWGLAQIERHNKAHQVFADAAAEIGRDISDCIYPNTLFLYCAETDAEAEEIAEEHLMRFSLHVEAHYQRNINGQSALHNFAPHLAGADELNSGMDDLRVLARSQFESNLIGSPRTIAEKIAAVKAAKPSMNYILCKIDGGAPPVDFARKSMALFADKVAPLFPDEHKVRAMA